MSGGAKVQDLQQYREPAPAPLEQPVFDAKAGWIELRRYGEGERYVAWVVRIQCKVPTYYSSSRYDDEKMDLCVLKVPIHSRKFEKLSKLARARALLILRQWRNEHYDPAHESDDDDDSK